MRVQQLDKVQVYNNNNIQLEQVPACLSVISNYTGRTLCWELLSFNRQLSTILQSLDAKLPCISSPNILWLYIRTFNVTLLYSRPCPLFCSKIFSLLSKRNCRLAAYNGGRIWTLPPSQIFRLRPDTLNILLFICTAERRSKEYREWYRSPILPCLLE